MSRPGAVFSTGGKRFPPHRDSASPPAAVCQQKSYIYEVFYLRGKQKLFLYRADDAHGHAMLSCPITAPNDFTDTNLARFQYFFARTSQTAWETSTTFVVNDQRRPRVQSRVCAVEDDLRLAAAGH